MKSSIPAATVSRLPVYLRSLGEISREQSTCSSEHIASVSGVNSAQVRKDLSYLGSHGVRGVGYNVDELRSQLRKALGLTHNYPVAIVGAGNLGSALVNYPGFVMWGFEVVALLDSDTSKMGSVIGRIPVSPIAELEALVASLDVQIGIIATPADAAQEVANRFSASGVRSILNFAPAVLQVPEGVEVRRVDLSTELQILAFHLGSEAAV